MAPISLPQASSAFNVRLSGCRRKQRIVSEYVVVVEVLVAACDAEDALSDELAKRVLDELGIAVIREAPGEPIDQKAPLRDLAQEQQSSIGTGPAGGEPAFHPPRSES
jgi:hypothetical protein